MEVNERGIRMYLCKYVLYPDSGMQTPNNEKKFKEGTLETF